MQQSNKNYISKRLETLLGKIEELNLDIINEDYLSSIDRNYLDISTDGTKISYIRTERLYLFDGDFYNETLRKKYATQGKPGGVMQVVLSRDIDYATQKRISFAFLDKEDIEVRIVRGNDIAKYYNGDTYCDIGGELDDSCMNKCPSSLFELYKKYCEMVILVNSKDKIYARSIIFRGCILGFDNSEKDIMSRIYAVSDVYREWLIEWGLENGFYIFNGRFNDERIIVGHGQTKTAYELEPYFLTEEFVPSEFRYLPYLDNFQRSFALWNGLYGIAFSDEYVSCREGSEVRSWVNVDSTKGGKGTMDGYSCYCEDCTFLCTDCHENAYGNFWEADHSDSMFEDDCFDPCETCSETDEDCARCIHN